MFAVQAGEVKLRDRYPFEILKILSLMLLGLVIVEFEALMKAIMHRKSRWRLRTKNSFH